MKADKDLYRQLRELPAAQLWSVEVPKYDQLTAKERDQQVALVRAVGVVFSTSRNPEMKAAVKAWMIGLLQDPSEKIRRYATADYRRRIGLADRFGSCHTALVGGYVIEGHVPAADILRLLREKPDALGLAVPGMPIGSPGMDGPEYKGRRDPYDVLLVSRGGATRVFQSHRT